MLLLVEGCSNCVTNLIIAVGDFYLSIRNDLVFPLPAFLMFTFVFARSLVRAPRPFADRLTCESQNDIVAILIWYFLRSKYVVFKCH